LRQTAFVIVITLTACSSGDSTIDITHDVCAGVTVTSSTATMLQAEGIDDALVLWRERGVTRLGRDASRGLTAAPPLEIRFEAASAAFRGLYDDERGVIFINSQLVDRGHIAIVVAHELGHAFGLEHVIERASVMRPGNLETPPNEADGQAIKALWGACEDAPSNSPY
jgi:hypothetical protein